MSFPRYSKYKDSGVEWLGEVPESWRVVPLKAVVSYNDEVLDEATSPNEEILYVDISSVDSLHGIIMKEAMRFSVAPSRARRRVRDGDVIISTVRTYLRAIARIKNPERNLIVSTGFAVVRPQRELVPQFLGYALSAGYFVEQVIARSTGVSYPAINASELVRIPVLVPPQRDQLAIAALLDRETAKIDALVAEQQRLIELLREKRQAIISHAVTKGLNQDAPMKRSGVEWLGDVPAHWEIRSLTSITTKITNGYVGPTRDILVEDGVRYLQSLHIKGNRIRFDVPYFVTEEWSLQHEKSILEVGDVLVVQTGDIGQAAVVTAEFKGCNCHALIVISPVRAALEGEWLSWCLNSDYGYHTLLSIQTGALHPHLNCGNVKSVMIPLPPRNEQRQIVGYINERIAEFDGLLDEAERAISILQERRATLITAAVTGKIDVRGLTDAAEAA